jgi:hypothetical protein
VVKIYLLVIEQQATAELLRANIPKMLETHGSDRIAPTFDKQHVFITGCE